jgi:Fe(3+) dicitrate transport protein
LVYDFSPDTRLTVAVDLYKEEHGEPGGLTREQYAADRNQTIRPFDRMVVTRNSVSAQLQHTFEPGMMLDVRAWGAYMDRLSFREKLGEGKNAIERQEFTSFGLEPRFRNDWTAWDNDHTFTAGAHFYTLDSPRTDKVGAARNARSGVLASRSQRDINYGALFAENKFSFGNFSITPGARVELLEQTVASQTFGDTGASYDKENSVAQPLFGLGLGYALENNTSLYGNVSQGYRGPIFTEALIPSPGATIQSDIDPATSLSYEIGYRGAPKSWFSFDTSLFVVDLDSRFGVIDNKLQNVGRSLNKGIDIAAQLDLVGMIDEKMTETFGSISLYANTTLLDAELIGGPNDGGRPQYAPEFMVRTGVIYSMKDKFKVSLLGTIMDDHNAQDSGKADFAIPSYTAWDLTAEYRLTENIAIQAGINNVFDETYFARVRPDGIDPAYGRNFYLGATVSF